MNKLIAEGFILHRKDGTEERIVRDVEIRVEEDRPRTSLENEILPNSRRVYEGNSWSFIPEELIRVEVPQTPLLRQTRPLIPIDRVEGQLVNPERPTFSHTDIQPLGTPGRLFNGVINDEWQRRRPERVAAALGLSIDEITTSNQITEMVRRGTEPIIGCGVRTDFLYNIELNRDIQPTFVVTGTGEWNPYAFNASEWSPRVERQPILTTGINAYWTTEIDQTSIPIEESNPKLKWFLDRIFRGQMPTLFVEPLDEWNEEEINYLSFEELIYTSDDERQFRIKNTQVRNRNRKFNITCGENTSISEITRGRSHLFVCLDEEIDGMVKE